jgi:hypothetical protein
MTLPTALAAPVDDGMMLAAAPRPPRQSFPEGPSTVFWVAVVAWTVVIKPSMMVYLSLRTLASGARQLVVHDALEICNRLIGNNMARKGGTTYDVVLRVVGLKVDTAYEHGGVGRGCGDDNLLGAAL